MANIPDKLINYRVYKDGIDLLGTADITLPEVESLSEAMKGAGIAGEVELPTLGHIAAMSMTINWRTVTKDLIALAAPVIHSLDFRVAQQSFDSVKGKIKTSSVRHVVRAIPKKFAPGKLETGATADASNEFSVTYYKMLVDGKVMIEVDPLNYIYIIDGVDYLKDIRNSLGI